MAVQIRKPTTQPAITPPTLDEDELPLPVPALLGILVVVITVAITSEALIDIDVITEVVSVPEMVRTSDDVVKMVGLFEWVVVVVTEADDVTVVSMVDITKSLVVSVVVVVVFTAAEGENVTIAVPMMTRNLHSSS